MRIRCADHTLYPQMLALITPTGGGRSVCTVRSRTKATKFFVCFVWGVFANITFFSVEFITTLSSVETMQREVMGRKMNVEHQEEWKEALRA
jgi:hypothetical protein